MAARYVYPQYLDFTTTPPPPPPPPPPHVPQYIRDNFPAHAALLAPSLLGILAVDDLLARWTPEETAEVCRSLAALREEFFEQIPQRADKAVVGGKAGPAPESINRRAAAIFANFTSWLRGGQADSDGAAVVGPDGAPTAEAKQYVGTFHPIAPELEADLKRPEFLIQAAGVNPSHLGVALEALHTIVLHSRPDIKATAWRSPDHSGQGMRGCECGAAYYCDVCEPILAFRCHLVYSRLPPDQQGSIAAVVNIKNCIARTERPTPPPPPPPYSANLTEKLFEAIARNDIEAAQSVDLSKIDVNAAAKAKQTILEAILAANRKGPWAAIALELAKNPKLDVNHQDSAGRSALTLAATHGFPEVLKVLLGREGVEVNIRTASKKTPLIAAVSGGASAEIVGELLKTPGVEVNAQDDDGKTAFMTACAQKTHLVRLFLQHPETDINLAPKDGLPPLAVLINRTYPPDGDWGLVSEFIADKRLQATQETLAALQDKSVIPGVDAIISALSARLGA